MEKSGNIEWKDHPPYIDGFLKLAERKIASIKSNATNGEGIEVGVEFEKRKTVKSTEAKTKAAAGHLLKRFRDHCEVLKKRIAERGELPKNSKPINEELRGIIREYADFRRDHYDDTPNDLLEILTAIKSVDRLTAGRMLKGYNRSGEEPVEETVERFMDSTAYHKPNTDSKRGLVEEERKRLSEQTGKDVVNVRGRREEARRMGAEHMTIFLDDMAGVSYEFFDELLSEEPDRETVFELREQYAALTQTTREFLTKRDPLFVLTVHPTDETYLEYDISIRNLRSNFSKGLEAAAKEGKIQNHEKAGAVEAMSTLVFWLRNYGLRNETDAKNVNPNNGMPKNTKKYPWDLPEEIKNRTYAQLPEEERLEIARAFLDQYVALTEAKGDIIAEFIETVERKGKDDDDPDLGGTTGDSPDGGPSGGSPVAPGGGPKIDSGDGHGATLASMVVPSKAAAISIFDVVAGKTTAPPPSSPLGSSEFIGRPTNIHTFPIPLSSRSALATATPVDRQNAPQSFASAAERPDRDNVSTNRSTALGRAQSNSHSLALAK